MIKEFEKKNQNVHIELIEGSDATDALEAAYINSFVQKGLHYDLIYMDVVWIARFAHEGWLLDLSDKLSKQETSEFLSDEIESGRYNNKLYWFPFHTDVGVLFYRKDLLNSIEHKSLKTFDDLHDVSQRLYSTKLKETKRPRWNYVWQGQKYEGLVAMFVEVLYGYSGYWVRNTFDVGLDKEPALKAIEFLWNTIHGENSISPASVTTSQEEETLRIFKDEDAVFLRSWPYVWSKANAPDSPIQGKIAIAPVMHARGQKSRPCRGGWGLGIFNSTEHPKEALQAIKFFTNADNQRRHALRTGNMPTRGSLFHDPLLVERYNYYPELLKMLNESVSRPSTPKYYEISRILQHYLYSALTEDKLSEKELHSKMKHAALDTEKCLKESDFTDNEKLNNLGGEYNCKISSS